MVAPCEIPEVPSWRIRRPETNEGRLSSNDSSYNSSYRSSSKMGSQAPMPVGRLAPSAAKQGHIQQVLWKTTKCAFFEKGCCKKGNSCSFAHGGTDTRVRPDLTKTVMCSSWQRRRTCKAGDACKFAHGQTDLRRDSNGSSSKSTSWNVPSDTDSTCSGTRTPISDEDGSAIDFSPTPVPAEVCGSCYVPVMFVASPPATPSGVATPPAIMMSPASIATPPASPVLSSSPTGPSMGMEVHLLHTMFGMHMEEALRLHAGMVAGDGQSREISQRTIQMMLESAAPEYYED